MARLDAPVDIESIEDLQIYIRQVVAVVNELSNKVEQLTTLVNKLQQQVAEK